MHYTLLAQYYYTCCEVQCLMFDLLLEYFHEITKITITGYLHHCTGKVKLQFPMHLNWLCIPYLGKILHTGTRLLVTVFFFGMHEIFHN